MNIIMDIHLGSLLLGMCLGAILTILGAGLSLAAGRRKGSRNG